jgi:hypothetical protein
VRARPIAIVVTVAMIAVLLAPSAALAGGPCRPRRHHHHHHHRSRGNGHALAFGIGALFGLAALSSAVDRRVEHHHVCRYVTRRQWVPGRHEPYTETRCVHTPCGVRYEEYTAYRWIPGHYITIRVRDCHRCR